MSATVDRLCAAIDDLTRIYEEILGRSVAKKWAVVDMDLSRLNRIVAEEEVLATGCRDAEMKREAATRQLIQELHPAPADRMTLSHLVCRIAVPALRERLGRAAGRLRTVLTMLGRVAKANRELIVGSLEHLMRFFLLIQEANAPRVVTYSRRELVAVRDPGHEERGLRFVDQRA